MDSMPRYLEGESLDEIRKRIKEWKRELLEIERLLKNGIVNTGSRKGFPYHQDWIIHLQEEKETLRRFLVDYEKAREYLEKNPPFLENRSPIERARQRGWEVLGGGKV